MGCAPRAYGKSLFNLRREFKYSLAMDVERCRLCVLKRRSEMGRVHGLGHLNVGLLSALAC